LGIPAGSTITGYSAASVDHRCSTYNVVSYANLFPFTVDDGTLRTLIAQESYTSTTAWAGKSDAALGITGLSLVSSAAVTLRVEYNVRTANNASASIVVGFDNPSITIEYDAASLDKEVAGSGHQTSYATGAITALVIAAAVGAGFQVSYGTGAVSQAQPVTSSGHQTSYGTGAVSGEVAVEVSGSGHQSSYGTGSVSAQIEAQASGSGYQAGYGSGDVDTVIIAQAAGSGYQASYGSGAATAQGATPSVSGDGYQTSVGGGAVAQSQPAIGAGYQFSYGVGTASSKPAEGAASGSGHQASYGAASVTQQQPVNGAGHQATYGEGAASVIIPITGSGYQVSYGAGDVTGKDAQLIDVTGDGHQSSYHTGSIAQAQPVGAGSGNQTSYAIGSAVAISGDAWRKYFKSASPIAQGVTRSMSIAKSVVLKSRNTSGLQFVSKIKPGTGNG